MKLEEVQIENYRCFENLTVKLNPRLNVIVGANGAGKSSLLEAICYSFYGNLLRFKKISKNYTYEFDPKKITIRSICGSNFPFEQDMPVSKNLLLKNKVVVCGSFYDESSFYRNEITFEKTNETQYELSCTQTFPEKNFAIYYRTSRNLNHNITLKNEDFTRYMNSDLAFENCLDASASYSDTLSWQYLRENLELREMQDNDFKTRIEYPDLKALRLAIKATLENVERVHFKFTSPVCYVEFKDEEGKLESIRLEQVSDGYRNMLGIIMDYARRLSLFNPTMENPLEAEGILLIDEIELHLHPKWQQRVLIDLQRVFPNTQIIVTTHSAAVLSTVHKENIILLNEDHQVETLPDDFGSYGAESSKLLAQVFGVDNRASVELKIGEKEVPINETIGRYLRLIEEEKHESDEAKMLRSELEKAIGKKDSFFVTADMRIKQIPFLKGLKNAQN